MEEKKESRPAQKKKYSSVFSMILHSLFTILLLTLASWFLLVVWFISRIGVQDGYVVSGEIDLIAKYNIEFILVHYVPIIGKTLSVLNQIQQGIHFSMGYIFEWISGLLQKINYQTALSSQQISTTVTAILFGTMEIVVYRLLLFIMNLPLLLCLLFVLFVDGLGQRDIRKFQGSRESTFFFHRIKPMTGKIFFILFLVYMSIPLVISPTLFLVPMSLILSVMTMLTVKNYKKYA